MSRSGASIGVERHQHQRGIGPCRRRRRRSAVASVARSAWQRMTRRAVRGGSFLVRHGVPLSRPAVRAISGEAVLARSAAAALYNDNGAARRALNRHTAGAKVRRPATRARGISVANTIALVDDDRNILTSVSMALEAEGFTVRCYADGAEALKGIAQQPGRPRHPRHQDAAHGRDGAARPSAQGERHAGHLPHLEGRRGGRGAGPAHGRRRLHQEAVLPAPAGRAHPRAAAPRRARRATPARARPSR